MFVFLDILVVKGLSSFTTSVFFKPAFTGLYSSWDTFVPKSRKINLLKCLTRWALIICSKSRIDAEIKKITDIVPRNGYSENVISSSIRSTISKFNSIKSFGLSKCLVYMKIPRIGAVHQLFADKIFLLVMWCFNSIKMGNIFTTRLAFQSSEKYVLHIQQQIRWFINFCADCISRTIQRLEVRVKQSGYY